LKLWLFNLEAAIIARLPQKVTKTEIEDLQQNLEDAINAARVRIST
jgi:hypothetical protein